MARVETTVKGATEVKARFLEFVDKIDRREIFGVVVTKRGRPVVELRPVRAKRRKALYGALKGAVSIARGVDLTEPLDVEWDADKGILYNR